MLPLGRGAQRSQPMSSPGFRPVLLRASLSHLSGRGVPHRDPPLVTFQVTHKGPLPDREGPLTCGN